jgi:hypothetical protein
MKRREFVSSVAGAAPGARASMVVGAPAAGFRGIARVLGTVEGMKQAVA